MSQLGQTARRKLEAFFGAEVSTRSLGMLRILIAATVLFQFTSPWVSHRVDDLAGTLLLTWTMFVSAGFVLFGFKTRLTTATLALSFAIVHLYYGVELGDERFAEPVLAFQVCVVLALTPCGRSLSVDRALEVRAARRDGREPAAERMQWWRLELFVLQTASVYFWATYDSCGPAWLSGEWLEYYFVEFYGRSDTLVLAPWLHSVAVAAAWVLTFFGFALAFGLMIRRARPYLGAVAAILQFVVLLVFSVTYYSSCFTIMMLVVLVACLPPQRTHDFLTPLLED